MDSMNEYPSGITNGITPISKRQLFSPGTTKHNTTQHIPSYTHTHAHTTQHTDVHTRYLIHSLTPSSKRQLFSPGSQVQQTPHNTRRTHTLSLTYLLTFSHTCPILTRTTNVLSLSQNHFFAMTKFRQPSTTRTTTVTVMVMYYQMIVQPSPCRIHRQLLHLHLRPAHPPPPPLPLPHYHHHHHRSSNVPTKTTSTTSTMSWKYLSYMPTNSCSGKFSWYMQCMVLQ